MLNKNNMSLSQLPELSIICYDVPSASPGLRRKHMRKKPQLNDSSSDQAIKESKRIYNLMPIIILVIICLAKDMSEIMLSFEEQGLIGNKSIDSGGNGGSS